MLAACGGDGPTEPQAQPGITVVAGTSTTDTVLVQPVQALVVEVRGPDGKLAPNTVVRFGVAPLAGPVRTTPVAVPLYVCALGATACGARPGSFAGFVDYAPGDSVAVDTTDANGRAKAIVRMGTVAGAVAVRITVPEFGMVGSAPFTVRPGTAARVRFAVRDTSLTVGAQATLGAAVTDQFGNARGDVPALALQGAGTVELNAATGAVTAREFGSARVVASAGQWADTAVVRVVPSGRLVVWEAGRQEIRLIGFDGSAGRTLATGVHSDFGTFPRFDASRGRVTFHTGSSEFGGPSTTAVVMDTTGGGRRDLRGSGLGSVTAVRQTADGTVLMVAQETATSAIALWRVDAGGTVTKVLVLPEAALFYGGADISPDGSRVAYVTTGGPYGEAGSLRALVVATGQVIILDPVGRSPRWSPSGDRVAFLRSNGGYGLDGTLVVIKADGTEAQALNQKTFSPGLAWSPDGAYVVGRSSDWSEPNGLRVVRARDGVDVLVTVMERRVPFQGAAPEMTAIDLYQPDWR